MPLVFAAPDTETEDDGLFVSDHLVLDRATRGFWLAFIAAGLTMGPLVGAVSYLFGATIGALALSIICLGLFAWLPLKRFTASDLVRQAVFTGWTFGSLSGLVVLAIVVVGLGGSPA